MLSYLHLYQNQFHENGFKIKHATVSCLQEDVQMDIFVH